MTDKTPAVTQMGVNVAGMTLRNPVMTASGTFGYGEEFSDYVDLTRLGAYITKGLCMHARPGNPTPRIYETPSGMLNAIGLQNVGIDAFIEKKLPFIRSVDTPCIVNFFGETPGEYAEMAARLDALPEVAALEMNISCPNVRQGGIIFGTDPDCAAGIVKACRAETKKPLIVKLSPNVTDIVLMAKACADAGADSLSLINTLIGMAIDINKRCPVLANITGGLSGPAVKPVALRMVWAVSRAVKLPIIGIGGIMTATDVVEFLMAGATAVQVGTASFINPGAAQTIVEDLEAWLAAHGERDVRNLIGAAHT